ncbi:hypothetical protein DB347_01780 [Opitutaceae bacterium EW11]|nr:hypothetical protein DB347_01780 [Opitutaceae bacterium EW11]
MTFPILVRVFAFVLSMAALTGSVRGAGDSAPSANPSEAERGTSLSREERRAQFPLGGVHDLQVVRKSSESRDDAIVSDLTFAAAPGSSLDRTAAFLIRPKEGAVRAAVLWVHWLGKPETTNRSEFLGEASALAGRGVVSLLVDAAWARPGWYEQRVLEEDYGNSVAQVVALCRAIELLRGEAGSAVPVAIVGHDYGAMYASIAASVGGPVKTCVFIACTPSLLDWAFYHAKPKSMPDYLHRNRGLEMRDYLGELGGASVLCQFAEKDRYVPLAKAADFFAAVSGRKQMTVYGGATHEMAQPATIRADREAWLMRELSLDRK